MTTFPGSPRLIKGGIVLIDATTSAVLRVIALQYNPDTLTRTLQVQAVGGEGDRLEALRLKGPPNESIKLDAEIDATDQLEFPDKNRTTAQMGIFPQLAVLETMVYPTSGELQSTNGLAQSGTLEISPAESALMLFVWSKTRILPVRLTEFSITEEAFDAALNPIRAKISLGMRVLSVNDLGFNHKGGNLFMAYLQGKEQLARLAQSAPLSALGITGIP
ncbi:MAG: hypothetical protein OEP48_09090 [Betaproteobacteria bacterium]|nr:hypothetical protein [Betaproteobacteria bacterium]MDH3435937.1 hypothetical protein [Betaproteobacteria bacterium]